MIPTKYDIPKRMKYSRVFRREATKMNELQEELFSCNNRRGLKSHLT